MSFIGRRVHEDLLRAVVRWVIDPKPQSLGPFRDRLVASARVLGFIQQLSRFLTLAALPSFLSFEDFRPLHMS